MHLFSVVPGSNLKAWRRPGPFGMGGELCGGAARGHGTLSRGCQSSPVLFLVLDSVAFPLSLSLP